MRLSPFIHDTTRKWVFSWDNHVGRMHGFVKRGRLCVRYV